MQTEQASNKDVVAPEVKAKTITQIIIDELLAIGFKAYGIANDHQVFTKPISETAASALYFFVSGAKVRIYQGIRKPNTPGEQIAAIIRARRLYTCKAADLEETVGLLAEQNYL